MNAAGCDFSKYLVVPGVVVRVGRLEILHLEVIGLDFMRVVGVVAGEQGSRFLAILVRLNYDFYRLNRDDFSLRDCRTPRRQSCASTETSCYRP